MAAIDTISLTEQAEMLLEYVKNPVKSNEDVERMIKLYQQGRLLDLYEMVFLELDDKTEAALLTKRNHVMVDRVVEMMKTKSVFIAIGSAHLPGEEGVLHLLQEKGYKVRGINTQE